MSAIHEDGRRVVIVGVDVPWWLRFALGAWFISNGDYRWGDYLTGWVLVAGALASALWVAAIRYFKAKPRGDA